MAALSAEGARIFHRADYDTVLASEGAELRRIMENAKVLENSRVRPTLSDRQKMSALLLEFIKSRGRIVYGGFAIDALVRAKDPEDAIYDFSIDAPDIEFYSQDAVADARDLCDLFHKKGYPYVRGTEAFHAETYKVSVDLVQLCDITYVPRNIHQAIPYVVLNGVKYAHPHFLLIDSLRIMTDPMASYWRLDKAFPRIYVLQKHYPLVRPADHDANLPTRTAGAPEVEWVVRAALRFFREDASMQETQSRAILIGYAAFDKFAAWSKGLAAPKDTERVPFLEAVLTDYKATVPKLFEHLQREAAAESGAPHLEYEEFQRFFDYCGRRGHVYANGKLALRLYHHNNRCTPVLAVSDDGTESETLRTASLSVAALYLMVSKLMVRARAPADLRSQAICDSLLYELYDMRRAFLAKPGYGGGIIGDHPFREFTLECVGQSVGVLRAHKEETEYRRSRLGFFGVAYFSYEPGQANKHVNLADFKYMNSSGNAIRSSAERWYSPAGDAMVTYAPVDDDGGADEGGRRTNAGRAGGQAGAGRRKARGKSPRKSRGQSPRRQPQSPGKKE